MKENITETAVIAMMPWVASIADIDPWLTIFVGVSSGIWIWIQIVLRIKREIREGKERKRKKKKD